MMIANHHSTVALTCSDNDLRGSKSIGLDNVVRALIIAADGKSKIRGH